MARRGESQPDPETLAAFRMLLDDLHKEMQAQRKRLDRLAQATAAIRRRVTVTRTSAKRKKPRSGAHGYPGDVEIGADPRFPTALLPGEEAAGFSVTTIANPDRDLPGRSRAIFAVACPIDQTNRVLKVRSASGGIDFVHRRCINGGRGVARDDLRWQTVFGPVSDPARAVVIAQRNKGKPDR